MLGNSRLRPTSVCWADKDSSAFKLNVVTEKEAARMPKYSIRVTRIGIQPDKYKPLSLSPVELDVIRFKRAKV